MSLNGKIGYSNIYFAPVAFRDFSPHTRCSQQPCVNTNRVVDVVVIKVQWNSALIFFSRSLPFSLRFGMCGCVAIAGKRFSLLIPWNGCYKFLTHFFPGWLAVRVVETCCRNVYVWCVCNPCSFFLLRIRKSDENSIEGWTTIELKLNVGQMANIKDQLIE